MDLNKANEIAKLTKHINDIEQQLKCPDARIRDVINDVYNDYMLECSTYENIQAKVNNSKIVDINSIPIPVLYEKLPFYKSLCIGKLLELNEKESMNNNGNI